MLGKILGGVAALIIILIVLGFVLPDKAHVERDIVINAPQEEVYALVSDLGVSNTWSPWSDYDPDMTTTVTGSGVGQKQVWQSKKIGNGSQEIAALTPPSRADVNLDFGDHGGGIASFILSPEGDGTRVVWTFDTNMRKGVPLWMQPMSTYMGYFMDAMLGGDYEKGLANLKRVAESS